MKIAFYPGSFNPWHEGHEDILQKALKIFDKIVILQLTNPDKPPAPWLNEREDSTRTFTMRVENQLLTIVIGNYLLGMPMGEKHEYAIIRGLRNAQDLEYEKTQQYWNETLGIKIPFVYFIADKSLCHVSSSAIRAINKFVELDNARHANDRNK